MTLQTFRSHQYVCSLLFDKVPQGCIRKHSHLISGLDLCEQVFKCQLVLIKRSIFDVESLCFGAPGFLGFRFVQAGFQLKKEDVQVGELVKSV